eukprot:TRINITY_DN9587_c0_g1_i1.p1 TRINITY_DN9587_c0_g1~~TRINITY_DN9587_c0_g1_i1.p1  ORF type:complete len:137 (+),score=19.54 TRINITY_DN9587_c0_g1_i1:123-533(+)
MQDILTIGLVVRTVATATSQISTGVKRIQITGTANDGATGCTAQRSSSGDLYIAPYCGKTRNGALRCRTEYNQEPIEKVKVGKWVSRASCGDDMVLTDCDSQIQAEINYCTEGEISREGDKGTNFGAFIARKNVLL